MSDHDNYEYKFRSYMGAIYSNDNKGFHAGKVTTTTARMMLNELYNELRKINPDKAEEICKKHNV